MKVLSFLLPPVLGWLMTLWVLAIFIALSSVKVSSCSRSFDCTRGLFDAKIKASTMCSSGLCTYILSYKLS